MVVFHGFLCDLASSNDKEFANLNMAMEIVDFPTETK